MNINAIRLRSRIAECGFTIASLASTAGVSESTLYRALNNGITPKSDTLELIAAPLGVTVEWLTSEVNDSEPVKNDIRDENTRQIIDTLKDFYIQQTKVLNEHLEYSRRQFRIACVVILALVAFICIIFTIDILNPGAGWLRY